MDGRRLYHGRTDREDILESRGDETRVPGEEEERERMRERESNGDPRRNETCICYVKKRMRQRVKEERMVWA